MLRNFLYSLVILCWIHKIAYLIIKIPISSIPRTPQSTVLLNGHFEINESWSRAQEIVHAVLIIKILSYIQIFLIVLFTYSTISMFLTRFRYILILIKINVFKIYHLLFLIYSFFYLNIMFMLISILIKLVLGSI